MEEYLGKAWRFNLKPIQLFYLKIHQFNILDIFSTLYYYLVTWVFLITEWIREQQGSVWKSAANLFNETYIVKPSHLMILHPTGFKKVS